MSQPVYTKLIEARKAGWEVTCNQAGPPDWQHYGAWVHHASRGSVYLVSSKADWSLKDARQKALDWINERELKLAPKPT